MYDYAIIGTGAAGLQLAIAMSKDSFFDTKKILLIDKSEKTQNDKTWCYWEKGEGQWDHLSTHSWEIGLFHNNESNIPLEFKPYRYKMLQSINFYRYARQLLLQKTNFHWIKATVKHASSHSNYVSIVTNLQEHKTSFCFDSRIDPAFNRKSNRYIKVLQHFKGYTIRFDKCVFNPNEFTLMDFRLQHKNSTSFMYILPTSDREALLEFTLFTKTTLPEKEYGKYIHQYIKEYISQSNDYQIIETEEGVIPMTNFPFHHHNKKNLLKIGTGGSWVRPSTGYSFKNSEHYVNKIISNIKANQTPQHNLIQKKHRFYDTLLLDILAQKNELGPQLFEQFYSKNNLHDVLQFLDGNSSFLQDLKIISSLDAPPFIISFFNQFKRIWKR